MCRWAAYFGKPIFLEEIISRPGNSLIAQSSAAQESITTTNGDGFGVAWYDARREPGLYRDVYPAWSDPNLCSVAHHIRSGLFLAHVRASTGSGISRNNCHPFVAQNWSFMHNGQVGGFESFRKHADMSIPQELYEYRQGGTDSEALFLMALAEGLQQNPHKAMTCAVGALENMSRRAKRTPHMRLSTAFTDGQTLYAIRYSSDEIAPSLYYRYSKHWQGWAVVSEPLDECGDDWKRLEAGRMLTITKEGAQEQAFLPHCPE